MFFGLHLLTRNANVGLELHYSSHEGEHSPHVRPDKAATGALGKPKEASETHRIWQKSLHTLAHLTRNMEISRLGLIRWKGERKGRK